jgi:hypothetical protein
MNPEKSLMSCCARNAEARGIEWNEEDVNRYAC